MWIVLGLIVSVTACHEECENACSLFNAPSSCYASCGCNTLAIPVPVSSASEKELLPYLRQIALSSKCSVSGFFACQDLACPKQRSKCFEDLNCEGFSDFAKLVETIPSHLWLAVRPSKVVNFKLEGKSKSIYPQFLECQATCAEVSFEHLLEFSEEYFESNSQCLKNFCAKSLETFRQECNEECETECEQNGEVKMSCLKRCTRTECGVTREGKHSKKEGISGLGQISNCGQVCFQQCYVNYQMVPNCYYPCLTSCQQVTLDVKAEVQDEQSEVLLKSTNEAKSLPRFASVCYQNCYAESAFSQKCFDDCLTNPKTHEFNPEAEPAEFTEADFVEEISIQKAIDEEKEETEVKEETEDKKVEIVKQFPNTCPGECMSVCDSNGNFNQACYSNCMQFCLGSNNGAKGFVQEEKGFLEEEKKVEASPTKAKIAFVSFHKRQDFELASS